MKLQDHDTDLVMYLQLWEVVQNLREFVVEVLLCILHFAHVEMTNT